MVPTFAITPEKEASIPHYFYRQWTYSPPEVTGVSLAGKTAIVTGSNTGLGLECSRQFLDLGLSKLILAVRSETKGAAAAAELAAGRNLPAGAIEVWPMDLADYDSIVAFAARANASLDRLDILVANAGLVTAVHEPNPTTGHDQVIQVNYLSTALSVLLLLPVIRAKRANQPGPTRITFTSSDASSWTSFKERGAKPLLPAFDRPDADMADHYFISKMFGQFFVAELAKHVPTSLAVINCATPGMCYDSELDRASRGTVLGAVIGFMKRRVGYTSAVGARLMTDAAVNHGEETHGQYLGLNEKRVKPMVPIFYTEEGKEIVQRLWDETLEELSFANVKQIIEDIDK
ncbi:putative short-chain dehydrogenase [Lasiosphaeria hispida]|uniref:Short-chain dehydrogenase n=1 Tax=Lasiosphaeria hispida TaxID=260671 RepID=A0AAJ0HDB8_9PEZI|nr:putative short-chain dehydrogenase [Lasiosphaeria hispida]